MSDKIMPWEYENKTAIRKYKATMSNGRGRLHEQMISAACKFYKINGRANIIKVPEPFLVVKKSKEKRGIATIRFTAHAQPDFIGCLYDGTLIAFEAKHTDTDRMQAKVITPTQAQALQDFQEMKAVSAVCAGIGNQHFMIPWTVFSSMKELYGRQYITAEDVQEYRVKFDGVIWFLDYIDKNNNLYRKGQNNEDTEYMQPQRWSW